MPHRHYPFTRERINVAVLLDGGPVNMECAPQRRFEMDGDGSVTVGRHIQAFAVSLAVLKIVTIGIAVSVVCTG